MAGGGEIWRFARRPDKQPTGLFSLLQNFAVILTSASKQNRSRGFSPPSNLSTYSIQQKSNPTKVELLFLAGVERFELPDDGVRVRSLTAWRHPNKYQSSLIIISNRFFISNCLTAFY